MDGLNLSPAIITSALATFLRRYHIVIFTVIVIGSLAVAVYLVNNVIAASSIPSEQDTNSSGFDQKTIDALGQLSTSDDPSPLELPTNQRINPFVE